LAEGELDKALIEAEELLDDRPSHPQALAIVGFAALKMGDIVMALEALNRFVELHQPDATLLHALSVARFEAVDYPGCLAAAEQATRKEPSLVAAWHYQGLALERLGKPTVAQARFEKAEALDPDHFPVPPDHKPLDWARLLGLAIDKTPQPIQVFYDGVSIRFAEFPAIEDLLENYPPLSPFTDALYRGRPPEDGDPWVYRPTQVTLFQGNLSRPSIDENDVIKRITDALMHEAMHWLGVIEVPA